MWWTAPLSVSMPSASDSACCAGLVHSARALAQCRGSSLLQMRPAEHSNILKTWQFDEEPWQRQKHLGINKKTAA
jgi:hypothetical protein